MSYNILCVNIWILGSYSKLDNMNLNKELKFYDKCLEASKELNERHDIEKKESPCFKFALAYIKKDEELLKIAFIFLQNILTRTL